MPLTISVVAVGLAIFFAVLAWRLARAERSRSAARVAVLGDAIDNATVTAPVERIDVQPAFLAQDPPSGPRGSALKIAAAFAGAVALIVAVTMIGTGESRRSAAPATANPEATSSAGSLELLSMRHQRDGDALTVTGLVRNAGSGRAERLIAVVFAFDRGGDFVASGRAPLEFISLGPGDESPFRVSVPAVGNVGRYRVSFRTETGVVRHVDRRQALVAHRTQ